MPAPFRVQVAAVRRDLDLVAADLRPYGPEALPDGPQVLRARPEDTFDLPRVRARRRVCVRPRPAEQPVPHVTADQVQLVPRLPERLAQAREGLGNLQLFMSAIIMIRF